MKDSHSLRQVIIEAAGPPKPKAGATSPKASSVKSDKSSIIDRSVLVNKIVEGLRGDAFLLARDLGLETLSRPGGLERLVEVIRNHVFPRALEESKELFSRRTETWRSTVKTAYRKHVVVHSASTTLVDFVG